jgi:DNA-binding beta-propeller fold protein YncE
MIRVSLINGQEKWFEDGIVIDPQGDWVYFYNAEGETVGIVPAARIETIENLKPRKAETEDGTGAFTEDTGEWSSSESAGEAGPKAKTE